MLRRLARTALTKLLERQGYELRIKGAAHRGFQAALADAIAHGVKPNTVFDIGVGCGTPWLYAAFPEPQLVLIEALPDFALALAQLAAEHDAVVHNLALGECTGEIEIFVPAHAVTGASTKAWSAETARYVEESGLSAGGRSLTVPVETLDNLNRYEAPFVLKLDVEGAELDVLKGAERTLAATQMVIAEAALGRRHEGGTNLKELLAYLEDRDFVLWDFCELAQRRPGIAIVYVDVVVLRRDLAKQ